MGRNFGTWSCTLGSEAAAWASGPGGFVAVPELLGLVHRRQPFAVGLASRIANLTFRFLKPGSCRTNPPGHAAGGGGNPSPGHARVKAAAASWPSRATGHADRGGAGATILFCGGRRVEAGAGLQTPPPGENFCCEICAHGRRTAAWAFPLPCDKRHPPPGVPSPLVSTLGSPWGGTLAAAWRLRSTGGQLRASVQSASWRPVGGGADPSTWPGPPSEAAPGAERGREAGLSD